MAFIWKLGEQFGIQFIKFAIQIFLARILAPNVYGIIAIILFFIAIADTLAIGGLSTALIQKRVVTHRDYSTVFWFSMVISILIIAILYIIAPFIGAFYSEDILVPVIRIMALSIFALSFKSIQIAYLSRQLQFRPVFIASTISCMVSGVIAIIVACFGYGIFALVIQSLLDYVITILILSLYVRLPIKLEFSKDNFKILFSYGWKLMASSLIAAVTENYYNLIIGRVYNTELTGYYSRGQQFPKVLGGSINGAINNVLLPAMSIVQDETTNVKVLVRNTISVTCYFMFPILAGLIATADTMVPVLLTDKWISCIPFLRLECCFYATLPPMYAAGQALKAIGKPQIVLKLEILKSTITLVLALVLAKYTDIIYLVAVRTAISLVILLVCLKYTKLLLLYNYCEAISDILPSLLIACVMGGLVYGLSCRLSDTSICLVVQLTMQIFTGILIYIMISRITKNKSMNIMLEYINNIRHSRLER